MKFRRSMLFIPGNNPGMLQNGAVFGSDSIIFDLEDAVAIGEKDSARLLVRSALKNIDYGSAETVVRINSIDTFAQEDIEMIVPCKPDALLVPKVESAADIKQIVQWIKAIEKNTEKPVAVMALLETAKGLTNAVDIAAADERVIALCLGAEDYTANIGAQRTKGGEEILLARNMIVLAAAGSGIQAIDTPFTDVNDEEGLYRDALFGRQLGFKGKLIIHPRQVDVVHMAFNPSAKEISWARRVIKVIKQAEAEKAGAVALDGKMIDAPIVKRAELILDMAEKLSLEGGAN